MSIVEAYKAGALWIMERERVAQSMRAFWSWINAPDFELDPMAAFEPVHAAIEGKQEFQGMFRLLIMHYRIIT